MKKLFTLAILAFGFSSLQAQIISTAPNAAPSFVAFKPATGLPADRFIWNYGDGRVSQGFRGAHTYSLPGTYTVTLEHTNATTLQVKTYTQQITIPDFNKLSGVKVYYVNCNTGSDTNDGLSTGKPWKTIQKVATHLNSLAPSARGNISYRLFSGCKFNAGKPKDSNGSSYSWLNLQSVGSSGQVRFEAYSSASGNFTPGSKKPSIVDDAACTIGGSCIPGYMININNEVSNLLFSNIIFSGNYNKFESPDAVDWVDKSAAQSYPTGLLFGYEGNTAQAGNILFDRVEITNLGKGIYFYPNKANLSRIAVTNSKISKIQMTPVAGQWGKDGAILNSTIEKSGQSHLTYLIVHDFVFQGNNINYSSPGATGHQSGLRVAGYPIGTNQWAENILIADNRISNTCGTTLALQRNGDEEKIRNVVIQGNILDGSFDPARFNGNYNTIWMWAPVIDNGDSTNVLTKNNLILEPRYNLIGGSSSNKFYHNTIIMGRASMIEEGASFPIFESGTGIDLKNNILSGHALRATGSASQIWGTTSGPNFLSAAQIGQSSVDFISTNRSDPNFLNLKPGSKAIEAQNKVGVLESFSGDLRDDLTTKVDMGALDFLATQEASSCLADINLDTFVDAMDYDAFIVSWAARNKSSDLNKDNFIDALDYDLFINSFLNGC